MRDRAAPVDPRAALRIYAYFVPLAFLLYVLDPLGPFFDIAITYILKDHLHVALGDAATFRVLTAIPVYAAVVFGFVRDRWSPFGQYDRGYFLLFAPLLALLFIHSPIGAVVLAVPMGMMGGLMWAAIHDLAMRSCPRGLHGTLMMFVSGMNALGIRGGDLIGTRLYAWGADDGFRWCVAVTTLMYLLLLGVNRCVPEHVTATADGEV